MYRYYLVVLSLLVTLVACSTRTDRSLDPYPYTDSPPSAHQDKTHPPAYPSERKRPMRVRIVTMGQIADALGVPWGYLDTAHVACAHHQQCRTKNGEEWFDRHQCQEEMATFWCEQNECREDAFGPSTERNTCVDEIWSRSCADLERPLECRELSEHGFVARINDWPQGPVPKGEWKSVVD